MEGQHHHDGSNCRCRQQYVEERFFKKPGKLVANAGGLLIGHIDGSIHHHRGGGGEQATDIKYGGPRILDKPPIKTKARHQAKKGRNQAPTDDDGSNNLFNFVMAHKMVPADGFEPPTPGSEDQCSIH